MEGFGLIACGGKVGSWLEGVGDELIVGELLIFGNWVNLSDGFSWLIGRSASFVLEMT